MLVFKGIPGREFKETQGHKAFRETQGRDLMVIQVFKV
jgi:hypothetical protein